MPCSIFSEWLTFKLACLIWTYSYVWLIRGHINTYLFPLYSSILSFCLYPFCLMELLLQEVAIYMSIKDISLSVVQLWSIYLKMYLVSHSFKLHCAYIFLAFCFHICQCWWQWLPAFCLLPLIVLVGSFWKCIVTVPLTLRSLTGSDCTCVSVKKKGLASCCYSFYWTTDLSLSLSGVCVVAARLLGQACWSARPSLVCA